MKRSLLVGILFSTAVLIFGACATGSSNEASPPRSVSPAAPAGAVAVSPVEVSLSTRPGAVTRYTLDGSRPDADSAVSTGTLQIAESCSLRVASIREGAHPSRPERFDFTSAYVREGYEYTGPTSANMRRVAIPPPWIWVQRLHAGLHAVLARLDARGAFAEDFADALDSPRDRIA